MSANKAGLEATIKKYTSAQAFKDLDSFLDMLPLNVGYNALIAVGIAWLLGGGAVMFTARETEKVSELYTSLLKVQAQKPPIPVLKYSPVSAGVLKPVADKITALFKGVSISSKDGEVSITAKDLDYFPQFLAVISYVQRGGSNWKVRIDKLCVGRDCSGSKLAATLKVESVQVGEATAGKAGGGPGGKDAAPVAGKGGPAAPPAAPGKRGKGR